MIDGYAKLLRLAGETSDRAFHSGILAVNQGDDPAAVVDSLIEHLGPECFDERLGCERRGETACNNITNAGAAMKSLDPGTPGRISRGLDRQLRQTIRRIYDQQKAAANKRRDEDRRVHRADAGDNKETFMRELQQNQQPAIAAGPDFPSLLDLSNHRAAVAQQRHEAAVKAATRSSRKAKREREQQRRAIRACAAGQGDDETLARADHRFRARSWSRRCDFPQPFQ